MANPLPLLLAAGAAVAVLGGKKKSKPKAARKLHPEAKTLAGQPCEIAAGTPEGLVCRDGILHPMIVDESMLEKDEEPTGDEAGDFETKEEDISPGDEDEMGTISLEMPVQDPAMICEEFLEAIYAQPENDGELPINKIAAEQTAIPTMTQVMTGIAQNLGKPVDPESVGPQMVRSALAELIPVCKWAYDENTGQFTYDDGRTINSEVGKEVLFGLMSLSGMLIDDFNAPDQDLPKAGFDPHP